jgi:hypothetical protein
VPAGSAYSAFQAESKVSVALASATVFRCAVSDSASESGAEGAGTSFAVVANWNATARSPLNRIYFAAR